MTEPTPPQADAANAQVDAPAGPSADDILRELDAAAELHDVALQFNDIGLVERLVGHMRGRMLFVPGLHWHIFREGVWELDDVNDALSLTRILAREIQQQWAAGELNVTETEYLRVLDRASSIRVRSLLLDGTAADGRMKERYVNLNRDPLLIALRNGVMDMRTSVVRPGRPEDRITQRADVAYDPQARCPTWEEHVKLITSHHDGTPDPALYAFLQRWAGYSLTGLVSEQTFAFMWGDGNNGKNVFIETLVALMGTYAVRASAKVLTGAATEHETVIADLAGARLAFIDETPRGSVNEARLKQLTGTEEITARKMRRDSFTFDARFKLWLAGNTRPTVHDMTDGFWRRLHLIPFEYTIPSDKRVKNFGAVLRAELPGILNWCLDGYRAWAETGLLPPSRVETASREYRDDQDTFTQFVHDCFVVERTASGDVDPAGHVWTPNKVIAALYDSWCVDRGVQRPPSTRPLIGVIADDLKRTGFVRHEKAIRIVWSQGGSKVERGWIGPAPLPALATNLMGWRTSARDVPVRPTDVAGDDHV